MESLSLRSPAALSWSSAELNGLSNSSALSKSARFNAARASSKSLVVSAKIRKTKRAPMDPDYPWPDKYKAEEKGFLAWFSSKKGDSVKKPTKPMPLPFERPVVDLQKKIDEVCCTPEEILAPMCRLILLEGHFSNTVDFSCRGRSENSPARLGWTLLSKFRN